MTREIVIYGVTDELGAVGIAEGIYPHIEFIQKLLANPYSKHDLAIRTHNAVNSSPLKKYCNFFVDPRLYPV